MSLKIFSSNLRYLMKQRKLSRKDLYEYLKVKPARGNAWFEGRAFPRYEQLIDICNALNYYDIHKMLTVDLKKGSDGNKDTLPANVYAALKDIIDVASGVLKHSPALPRFPQDRCG